METAVVKAYRNTNAVRRFFNGTLGTIFCILLIMVLFFSEGGAMVVRLIVLGIIFLGLQLGKKGILKYLDRQEYLFYEDRIEVAGWKKKVIPYDEILMALQTRKIQVRKEMFCILIGEKGFLKLQYEIGEKRRERKQRECIAFLNEKLPVPLPEMTNRMKDILDRNYYFSKMRKTSGRWILVCALIHGFLLAAIGGLEMVMMTVMALVLQLTFLFTMFHRTEWGRKARARLDEELKEYPHLEVKVKQVTYTRVWIVTAVYILLYLFWFWVYLAV